MRSGWFKVSETFASSVKTSDESTQPETNTREEKRGEHQKQEAIFSKYKRGSGNECEKTK